MSHISRAGDVFLTRNTDAVGNDSPGYWNHAAISAGTYVIEAQAKPNAVIAVHLADFIARYPEFLLLRNPDAQLGYRAAQHARSLVGTKYRKIASIFRFLRRERRGENCVSVVRKAYKRARGADPRWLKPDDVAASGLFYTVVHYRDYNNWRPPSNWLAGRIA